MRLRRCTAKNFGSYKELEIDFSDIGLCLAYGPTGSGKSTLADLACWALFGVTAKGGAVDDVRNWQFLDKETVVTLEVELNEGSQILVTRKRGKTNDLFWTKPEEDTPIRGKDAVETQRLLNETIGFDDSVYLMGAYLAEFSPISGFFLAKAKDRRAIFENLANLDFAAKIAEKSSEKKKELKDVLAKLVSEQDKLQGKLEMANKMLAQSKEDKLSFENTRQKTLAELQQKFDNFELIKASKIEAAQTRYDKFEKDREDKIDDLLNIIEKTSIQVHADEFYVVEINKFKDSGVCTKCGQSLPEATREVDKLKKKQLENRYLLKELEYKKQLLKDTHEAENPHAEGLEAAKVLVNQYKEMIKSEKSKVNPYTATIQKAITEFKSLSVQDDEVSLKVDCTQFEYDCILKVYDLSFQLRAELLRKAVACIQNNTNEYLEKYFDSELRVSFKLQDSDKLEVEIQKNGYPCNYKQLSKGQRGLLKLTFSVSVMEAASNKAGVHFDTLAFDESLDGLDTDLKVKAFRLFQELANEHSTVLLIDHAPEFHQLFDKKFKTKLVNDCSVLEEDNG